MVDPKRHINVLSNEDQMFLNECEEEFKDRFSEDDAEFTAYCAQQSRTPPVLTPWQSRNFQGGYGGGGGRGRFNDRGGRGGGGGRYNHNNRNYRGQPYQRHGNRYNNNRDGQDSSNRYNSNVGRNYS